MRSMAAVRIDNDLSPRETAISHGSADHKTPGRIHIVLRLFIEQLFRNSLLDDFFDNGFLNLFVSDGLVMLGAHHDRIDALGNTVFVLSSDLGFSIRSK